MSVSFGAKGTTAYGSTSVAPSFPSGISSGMLLLLVVGTKPGASATIATPNGWQRVGSDAVGTSGSNGADTGPTRVAVFRKIAVGTEAGTQSVAISSGNSSWGDIYRLTSSTGTFSVAMVTGEDTSSGTGFSASCAAPAGWAIPGDMLLAAAAKPTDAGTWSAEAFTATGLTIGSATEIAEYTTSTGNDIGGAAWYATVSSGTMSGTAVVATATLSSASYGPAAVVRIRDTAVVAVVGSNVGGSTNNTGATITNPAGAFLLAAITGRPANITPPSGWTKIWQDTSGEDYQSWYTASSGASSNWGNTFSDGFSAVIIGFDQVVDIAQTTGTYPTSPTATATKASLVARILFTEADLNPSVTFPPDTTDQVFMATSSVNFYSLVVAIAFTEVAGAGSVGTATPWAVAPDANTGTPALTLLLTRLVKAGTGSGGFSYAGAAAGVAPSAPPNEGTASGGFAYAGLVSGEAPPVAPSEGTASGGFSFAGSASGEAVDPSEGTGAGGFTFTGSAAGSVSTTGTGAGGFTYVGDAVSSTVHGGAAAGGFSFTGASAGATGKSGTASGGFTYAGTATSSDISTGTASGGYSFSGTTSGARAAKGSAAGSVLYVGAASGVTSRAGAAAGTYLFAGSASSAVIILRDISVTAFGPYGNPLTVISIGRTELEASISSNPLTINGPEGNNLYPPSPQGNPLTLIGGTNG